MQAIETRYCGPTDTKGSRIRASCEGGTVYVSYGHTLNSEGNHYAAVKKLCDKLGWDAALDRVADRFAGIIDLHGPDAVGLYLSGQLLTEDYYVFNKLAKALIGSNNVDTNSRLCMSSAVAGYKASLGSDAVPACYDDLPLAQTVFITGANPAWAHPVLYRRLEDARRARPGMKVIVVDPRRTETAAEADLHLQLLPGTDVVLHHAMLHLMLWEGLVDHAWLQAHTSGFEALRDRVRAFSPAHAAKVCGVGLATEQHDCRDRGHSGVGCHDYPLHMDAQTRQLQLIQPVSMAMAFNSGRSQSVALLLWMRG